MATASQEELQLNNHILQSYENSAKGSKCIDAPVDVQLPWMKETRLWLDWRMANATIFRLAELVQDIR